MNTPAGRPSDDSMLRLLFEQAPGFVAVLEGPQHIFTLANPAYLSLIGRGDLVGRSVVDAVPEAVEQGFLTLLDNAFATGRPYVGKRVPLQLQRPGGAPTTQLHVDFVYQPIFDATGNVAGIFVQGQDVSDHVQAEERLRLEVLTRQEQSRVFETLLSSIEDFAYIFDRQRRFTFVNKPLLDLWNIPLAEAVGKNFFELSYPPALAQRLDDEIEQVFQTGKSVRNDTYYRSLTGKDGWYEYVFSPVRDDEGQVVTVAGSTRDITLRRKEGERLAAINAAERAARDEAERAGRMKDEFLATLSHELRTPLNAILGWAELLRAGQLSPEKATEAAERITRNARSQAGLIADLLDLSGIMSGKVRLDITPVPIVRPLGSAIDAIRVDSTRKKIHLAYSPPAGQCVVDCDPNRLQQIFLNLLTNAIKFTPAGGTITVSVDCDEDSVTTTVTDTGLGIEPGFIKYLFDRFSQADSSSTRKHGGLGLGLSIVKSLVEMHGGDVHASSSGKNTGATFTVVLPLKHAANGDHPSSQWGVLDGTLLPRLESVTALRGVSTFIVDDNEESRVLVSMLLEQYGATVHSFGCASDALKALQKVPADLLVLDIDMPDVDGYQLFALSRAHSQCPAIAVTALAGEQDVRKAKRAGFSAHIAKPFDPSALLNVCTSVLNAR